MVTITFTIGKETALVLPKHCMPNPCWTQWQAKPLSSQLWLRPYHLCLSSISALKHLCLYLLCLGWLCLQEDEGGGAPEETRFQLPSNPSPGVMMFLLAASRELQRCGLPAPGSPTLEILQWELGKGVLSAFKYAPLDPPQTRVLGKCFAHSWIVFLRHQPRPSLAVEAADRRVIRRVCSFSSWYNAQSNDNAVC